MMHTRNALRAALSCTLIVWSGAVSAQQSHRPGQAPRKPVTHAAESPAAAASGAEPTLQVTETKPSASVEAAPAEPTPVPSSGPATKSNPAAPPAEPETAQDTTKEQTELASLHQDLAQVMDDLVQARARVAVLGKALFKTRVRLKIDDRTQKEQSAVRVLLWLDGAPIWSGDGSGTRDPNRVLFDGFAAPGPHVLTLEIEQRARRDEAYRYTLHESYRFLVVREKRTDLRLRLDDDSDMADDFPSDAEGEYDVRTRFQARAVG
ncbi:MAG: hypothetical protein ACHQ53_15765, partial [Polyangiales bacterium]